MTWTLTTSGAAFMKAGVNVSSVISGALLATLNDEAEDTVCMILRKDVISNYSSLTTNGKKSLGALASSIMAQTMVAYDMSSYTDRREAETILDKLENDIDRLLVNLRDEKNKAYLGAV